MKNVIYLLSIFIFIGCSNPETNTQLEPEVKAPQFEAGISTINEQATLVGKQILEKGGNAFDAAVATHFTMAVTCPRAGNLGGGGFALIYTENQQANALDFREKAGLQANKEMFLDEDGKAIEGKSLLGALAAGVPGSVQGMWELHKKYGSMEWKELVQPAIDYAQNGFAINEVEAKRLNELIPDIKEFDKTNENPFVTQSWKGGDIIKQEKLAETLRLIADSGANVFYLGSLAKKIANDINSFDGIISTEDLANYESVFRTPVKTDFEGRQVYSMPPPSSGGIALIQLLNGIKNYPIRRWGKNHHQTLHIYTELMRRVYADRTTFLGDPDFYPVPTEKLIDQRYLEERFVEIILDEKTPSDSVKAGNAARIESYETTHYSILDKNGNAVSITTTLNSSYGSKVWLPSVGFFLNNEMDDFSVKEGVANQFGLLGGLANQIEPEKRMLSSMTPTVVVENDRPVLLVGSPGGSTIITSVFQTIVNLFIFENNLHDAINTPRIHHQWQPEDIIYEIGKLNKTLQDSLMNYGHTLDSTILLGRQNCVYVDKTGKTYAEGDKLRYTSWSAVIPND